MTLSPAGLEPYRAVAPKGTVDFLLRLAERVQGRRFLHVNSTREGGGVARYDAALFSLTSGRTSSSPGSCAII